MPSTFFRTPVVAITASVVLHGGLFAAAWAFASADVRDRPASVVGFLLDDRLGAAADEPLAEPPPELRVVDASLVEAKAEPDRDDRAVAAEPLPPEIPVADDLPAVPTEPLETPMPTPPPLATAVSPLSIAVRSAPVVVPAAAPVAVMPSSLPPPATRVRASSAPTPVAAPGVSGMSSVSVARPTNRPFAYPAVALANRWEGTTSLYVEVREDGRVGRVTVVGSSGYSVLDDAAVATVSDWLFEPAMRDGLPVADAFEKPVTWRVVDTH